MHTHYVSPAGDRALDLPHDEDLQEQWRQGVRKRSLLLRLGLEGAPGLPRSAVNHEVPFTDGGALTEGDVAILRLLAAIELIESDLWQQYDELGGVDGGNPAYIAALQNLDSDIPQYIADTTCDEISHAAFLNAYLRYKGAPTVNLDGFRRLPSSESTGARQVGRLTNLMVLDTSSYARCRRPHNCDPTGRLPEPSRVNRQAAIPLNDADSPPGEPRPKAPVAPRPAGMQAIAITASSHFARIEERAATLYRVMALKATSLEALRIIVSIGGAESNHFWLWLDKAGNAVARPPAGATGPPARVTFPDQLEGAVATINSLAADGLFEGQTPKFFETIHELGARADAASRNGM